MDSLVTRWGREGREGEAGVHNGVFVFTTERDLQLERVQLQIRKAPPGGRGAWRRSTVAPEARATGRVSADQRNAALLLPPFRPAAPAHRSAMHTTAATVIGLPPTRALASLEPVPKRKRFYLLARSKPPVFVDRARRQPVFMTILIRLITAARCLGIGRRLIITKI